MNITDGEEVSHFFLNVAKLSNARIPPFTPFAPKELFSANLVNAHGSRINTVIIVTVSMVNMIEGEQARLALNLLQLRHKDNYPGVIVYGTDSDKIEFPLCLKYIKQQNKELSGPTWIYTRQASTLLLFIVESESNEASPCDSRL